MEAPTSDHMLPVKKLLRYIKVTVDCGLVRVPGREGDMQIIGYSDSNYTANIDNRKITLGHYYICAIIRSRRAQVSKSVLLCLYAKPSILQWPQQHGREFG